MKNNSYGILNTIDNGSHSLVTKEYLEKNFVIFLEDFSCNDVIKNDESYNFQNIIQTYLVFFENMIINKIDFFGNFETVSKSIMFDLEKRLYQVLRPSLIVYINKLRVEKALIGIDTNEEYKYFTNNFFHFKKFHMNFFRMLPLLSEKIFTIIENEINYIIWLQGALEKDQKEIHKMSGFNIMHVEKVINLGDYHNNGRRTILLEDKFNNKVILKPVDLTNSILYHSLINQLNKDLNTDIFIPQVVNKNNYGYMEYINHESCESNEQIKGYYYNLGVVLSVIYLINGSDIHNENIIAKQTSPVIIDFETLGSTLNPSITEKTSSFKLSNSVLNSRMLPIRFSEGREVIRDYSAIGRVMKTLVKKIKIKNEFTSNPIEIREETIVEDTVQNLPFFYDDIYEYDNYIKDIIKGFEDAYNGALKNKEEYMHILKSSVSKWNYRKVYRNTKIYTLLLDRLNVPDLLENKLKTIKYLRNILEKNTYLATRKDIIQKEIEALLSYDVPYFSNKYEWESCETFSNNEIDLEMKFEKISYADFLLQRKIIEMSLSNQNDNLDQLNTVKETINFQTNLSTNKIKEALTGKILDGSYISKDGDVDFIGLKTNWQGELEINHLNNGIYDGLLGISSLLRNNADPNHIEIINKLEQKALQEILNKNKNNYGFVNGSNAIISYYLTNLPYITPLNEKVILQIFMDINSDIEKDEYKDNTFDILGGSAGLILTAVKFYQINPKYKILLKVAENLGDYIVNNMQTHNEFVYWKAHDTLNLEDSLKGFVHGLSGQLLAFYKLKDILKTNKYDRVIHCIHKSEKMSMNEYNYTDSWCKGFSGMGISRIKILELYQNEDIQSDLIFFKNQILSTLYENSDYCLCHGLMGKLDFLLELENRGMLERNEKQIVMKVTNNFLNNFAIEDFNPHKIALFTGLGSILYFLQRLENDKLNSILYFNA
ncbi:MULTISPECIES: type 2 lanthipeptide synthetase LanM [Bacillus]|uniref:type 2 lanthipeptide synthetase LanM n=1 Tax=Bacillus TaxID=1386 RepID=UPI0003055D5E|nr:MULTISPECIES: type 2 lanthipeptide synthetase LanM [Bacillus]KAB0449313.1 type 2 lantipeptide synthetase LanM [Lysinibacillus sp. VIA-II-2016]MBJ8133478.1 type 2 lantipeptide synthetase LanM [Bacillus cereus group sp. N3]PEB30887.1 type 2 lantipeptide synthetase LanM [Bacillus toyonensis]PED76224.1 type 2 lantipeptide synthetase LanM [Bacillus toyonensis]PHD83626.1 type 2 lantipeptide synthetase LanM [Bacillus toyonensis]